MGKENYLSESAIRDKPTKRFSLKLKDGSVTAEKLSKGAIEEIAKKVDISVIGNEDIDFIMNKNELI